MGVHHRTPSGSALTHDTTWPIAITSPACATGLGERVEEGGAVKNFFFGEGCGVTEHGMGMGIGSRYFRGTGGGGWC